MSAADLVDSVEGDVEAVASLVFDHGDFNRALAHKHRFHTAVNPYPVLEMHDVVARLERGQTLESGARRVAPRSPKATLAAKDLMVGEDPVSGEVTAPRRNDESAVENSDRESGRRDTVVVQKLVETLGLTSVVAEDCRRDSVGDDLLQTLHVAQNLFGLPEREYYPRIITREIDRSVCAESLERGVRRLEQLVAAWGVFPASPGEVDVVLCLRPGSLHLRLHVSSTWDHEQSVRRKKRAN